MQYAGTNALIHETLDKLGYNNTHCWQDGSFHDIVPVCNLCDAPVDASVYSVPYPVEEPVPEEWKRGRVEVYWDINAEAPT